MKVCTDACLFGALLADSLQHSANCLDIGTGTGLLSLMLAQKNKHMVIDAVEIDLKSAEQAKDNFALSPWTNRLHVFNTDVLSFENGKQYDCIISNPPFFEDDLHSPDAAKNNAKHNTTLNLKQLLKIVNMHLAADGVFAVLLSNQRLNYFIEEAAKIDLYLTKKNLVKQSAVHDHFRGILFFSRIKSQHQISEIIIKNNDGDYTKEFITALKDYYLFL